MPHVVNRHEYVYFGIVNGEICWASRVLTPFLCLVRRVLHHYKEVVSVGGHHDLVLLCPQPHESEIIAGVNFLEHCLGLVNELDH